MNVEHGREYGAFSAPCRSCKPRELAKGDPLVWTGDVWVQQQEDEHVYQFEYPAPCSRHYGLPVDYAWTARATRLGDAWVVKTHGHGAVRNKAEAERMIAYFFRSVSRYHATHPDKRHAP